MAHQIRVWKGVCECSPVRTRSVRKPEWMLLVGAFAISKSDASLGPSLAPRQVETGFFRRRNYLAVSLPHQDSRAVRLLFVKLKHIGDALLLTPTLTAVRAAYPQAEIWVVVRKGTEGILAGCPAIDRLLTAAPPEASKRSLWNWADDFKLVPELRRQKFHHAFELSDGGRSRWLCWLSTAKNRTANVSRQPLNFWWRGKFNSPSHYNWRFGHRVEKDYFTVNDCLPLPSEDSAVGVRSQPHCRVGNPAEALLRLRGVPSRHAVAAQTLATGEMDRAGPPTAGAPPAARHQRWARFGGNGPSKGAGKGAGTASIEHGRGTLLGATCRFALRRKTFRRRGHGGNAPGCGVSVSDDCLIRTVNH